MITERDTTLKGNANTRACYRSPRTKA